MAGHSKWHNIRIRKGRQDAARGKLLSKCAREIIVAARLGGGDPDANPRLRHVLDRAREVGMPRENIERAIKRGIGELNEGEQLEESIYEGYGPGGVAILVETVTDNRNRTSSQVRRVFTKNGGKLGAAGCVSWLFAKKALVVVSGDIGDEETVMSVAIDVEAEDVAEREGIFEITGVPSQLGAIKQAVEDVGIMPHSASVISVPSETTPVEGEEARRLLRLLQELEEHEDVQNVSANFDMPDDILDEISAGA